MILINNRLNGNLIFDDGYYFGRALFETILVKEKPIFLEEHLKRLNSGLKRLNIDKSITKEYIKSIIEKYKIENQVLKIIVSEKNIIVSTREVNYTEDMFNKGFIIKLSEVRRNSTSLLSYLKSVNYIENIIEKEKAKYEGFDEAIFLNERDEICEGTSSNLFFVKNGNIYTPEVNCGLLDGIVRAWLINNFNVEEGRYNLQSLLEADEIFLTNSVMGIMRVSYVDKKSYKSGDIINAISQKYIKAINAGATL